MKYTQLVRAIDSASQQLLGDARLHPQIRRALSREFADAHSNCELSSLPFAAQEAAR
jgi:hypothetical protein